MDIAGGARIAVDRTGFASVDSIEDQLRELRRERDALRRENRILKIAVAELERVSERDTLTPLFNRRYFLTAIHQRLARFERHAESAAVVFIDVNQLKYINDSFGHAAGDFALPDFITNHIDPLSGDDDTADLDASGNLLSSMPPFQAPRPPLPEQVADGETIVAPESRNAPCPCGSGRKYKHCHGQAG